MRRAVRGLFPLNITSYFVQSSVLYYHRILQEGLEEKSGNNIHAKTFGSEFSLLKRICTTKYLSV